jgi:prolipoprotein diacylglyceryltransferase
MLPVLLTIGPVTVYSFSLALGIGFFLGVFIAWRRLRDLGLDEEKILDAVILGSLSGLVFSRLIFAAEFYPQGGFSFWGGLAGFLLVFFLFAKTQKWDFWQITDELTFAILPFAVLGQIGALLDGSTPGKPTVMPWGIYFPGSLIRSQPISLVMALAFFAVWIFLLRIERYWRTWDWYKSKAPGFIFLTFLGLGLTTTLVVDFWSLTKIYWFWFKVIFGLVSIIMVGLIFLYRSGRLHGKER